MIDAAGLRVMKAIADEGSFTGAAHSLGFSQPAISQMVRRLEQRTGTVLVERYGRQVRLTEAGQVLARHAVGVLAALDAAEEEITAIAGLRAGRVRLQAFPSSSATLVPKALAILKRHHPDIVVTLTEAEPPESLAALRNGDCDVAVAFAYEGADLGVLEEDLSLLQTHHLLDDEVRVVVPKSHQLADRQSVRLSDFADEEWIAGCPRCRGHLVSLADHEGFRPNVAFEIEDYVAQIGLVTAGLGVALVPDLILNAAKHEDVATLSLSPVSRRQILAVTTSDLQRVPAVAAALRALGEAAGARVDVPEPALSPA
ncbi:LysR family transcriptional regulator [Intrasporangium calvum]|uniref:Transcriptional regulator, LysR family n=1 Tax=Intrasporangium calvum (strain ATCC 23552 / DSM 43043 / JCM 3097 / NBRC 12989 / NCIMB 10167 / NRRL B-3866 / 7 KIP) TaxID=710696 RepID=E6S7N8_INTC7|nr:LysR family transcriptional regulator [Intrasporangium calvum]ADU47945.1 transcriptional regulator, LysR family [Intrasporangium calvum DSM 43043]